MKRVLLTFIGSCVFAWTMAGVVYGRSYAMAESSLSFGDDEITAADRVWIARVHEEFDRNCQTAISVGEVGTGIALIVGVVMAFANTAPGHSSGEQVRGSEPSPIES